MIAMTGKVAAQPLPTESRDGGNRRGERSQSHPGAGRRKSSKRSAGRRYRRRESAGKTACTNLGGTARDCSRPNIGRELFILERPDKFLSALLLLYYRFSAAIVSLVLAHLRLE